jgi:hypothetical protein
VPTTSAFEFPFQRDRLYPVRELRAFEAQLLVARQRDPEFSKLLRVPRGPAPGWIRLRNKELVPLKLFADHTRISDDEQFLLRPEGDPVDAQIVGGGRTLNLQFTLAAPIWGAGYGAQQNSGYQQHQLMVALNESECVVGYPPFITENGIAMGEMDAISNEDRDAACRRGLSSSTANKTSFDGRGCTLAVFARDFYKELLHATLFEGMVDAVLQNYRLRFDSACVYDSEPGFFVERRLQP